MNPQLSLSRRALLRALAVVGAAVASGTTNAFGMAGEKRNRICAFTKPLQSLDFGELADRIAELGFDGIEAPVRPGGHIEPERVEDDLPRMVEALSARGLKIYILTSGILSVKDPHTSKVLTTAARLGIPYYRLAYFKYDLNRDVSAQLEEFRAPLRDLIAYSRELGIVPLYQNHSGRQMVGAPLWDLHELIKEYPADVTGVAFDLAHAKIEGGQSWPIQLNLLRKHIRALYVKDFRWDGGDVEWVPLGKGLTDSDFYRNLAPWNFSGPVSVHVEYLEHSKDSATKDVLNAFAQDLAQLRRWMGLS